MWMWAFHTLQDIPVPEVYTKIGKMGSSFVFSTYFSKCCLPDNNILLWKCQNRIFQCSEEFGFFFPDMNVVKVMIWIPENLFCVGQRSDLLGLPYFFLTFFFFSSG